MRKNGFVLLFACLVYVGFFVMLRQYVASTNAIIVAFGLAMESAYMVNDMLDKEGDQETLRWCFHTV